MAVRNGASVTIPVNLQVQMNEIAGQLEKVRKAFASVKPEAKSYKQLEGYLKSIEREFENIKKNAGETFTTHGQIDTFARRFERLKITAENFNDDLKKLDFSAFDESALNQELVQQISEAKNQIDSLQQSLTNLAEDSFRNLILNSQEIGEVLTRLRIDPEDFIAGKGFDTINNSTKDLIESIKELKKEQEKKAKDKDSESNKLNKQQEIVAKLEDSYLALALAADAATKAREKADRVTRTLKRQKTPELEALDKAKAGLAADKKNFGTKTGRTTYGATYFDGKGNFKEGGKEALAKYLISSYNLTQKDLEEAGLEKITEASLSTLYTVLLEKVNTKIKKINEEIKKAETDLQQKNSQAETAQTKATSKEQELKQAEAEVSRIQAVINNLQTEINSLNQKAEEARAQIDQNNLALEKTEEFGRQVEETVASSDENARIRELTLRVQELENQLKQAIPALQQASDGLEETAKDAGEMSLKTRGMSEELKNSNEQLQRLNEIQNSIKQWFGFNEVINLTKNAVRDAISHIRELDAVMTEIAVVTDMTQQELWDQISTYSEMARQYGATTQGVYEVSQLYYQQGLQTAEVMQLTEETLKMARIASINYADATDYMTVAIRGFKLEMSDAQNVVDVYSNIAAVTASDTEELAVAMSKTASSAEAVGSSFENTTAMIALMVETTREAPQNIGSAIKSIISRYGEMTTNPASIVDSEGEELSLNKVDKALQSVGITLQDVNGQFRDFDDVILELSSKWDTIDKNTQRYIATVMAGNRQQSRFLALVGNYDRLSELYEEAANSQDAATLQTLKTMDSIETKINQLKTTFQEFYTNTGIEDLIKGVLDFTTQVIERIDSIPKVFGKIPLAAIGMIGTLISTGKIGLSALVSNLFKTFDSFLPQVKVEGVKWGEAVREGFNIGVKDLGKEAKQEFEISAKRAKIGTTLAAAGSAISALSLALGNLNTETGRAISGSAQLIGGIASSVGQFMTGNYIGAIISLVSTAISAIDTFVETAEEKIERLKKQADDVSNEALLKKNDYKNTKNEIDRLKDLEKARFDSNEAYQEWLDYQNEIADKYPQLISHLDGEGNAILDLSNSYDVLANSRKIANQAAIEAQKTNIELTEAELEQAEEKRNKKLTAASSAFGGTLGGYNFSNVSQAATFSPIVPRELDGEYVYNNTTSGITIIKEFFDPKESDVESEILNDKQLEFFKLIEEIGSNPFTSIFDLEKLHESIYQLNENASEGEKVIVEAQQLIYEEALRNIASRIGIVLEDEEGNATYNNTEDLYKMISGELDLSEQETKMAQKQIEVAKKSYLSSMVQWSNAEQELLENTNFTSLLTEIPQINSVIEDYLKQQAGDQDLKEYVDSSNFDQDYQVIIEKLTTWFTGLNSKAKEIFITAYSGIESYSFEDFKKLVDFDNLPDDMQEILAEQFNHQYETVVENFYTAFGERRRNLGIRGNINVVEFSTKIGSEYFDDILTMYDSYFSAFEEGNEYLAYQGMQALSEIWNAVGDLEGPLQKQVSDYLISDETDLTSLQGIYQVAEHLKELGADENLINLIISLSSTIVPNLTIEWETYLSNLTGSLEGLSESLDKASTGMDFEEASTLAKKLGTSLTDENFVFSQGKYFYNNIEEIRNAYLKEQTNIREKLQQETKKQIELLGTSILRGFDGFERIEDEESYLILEKTYKEAFESLPDNEKKKYTNWQKYAINQLSQAQQEYSEAEGVYLQYLINSTYLASKDLESFLGEMTKQYGDSFDSSALREALHTGDISNLTGNTLKVYYDYQDGLTRLFETTNSEIIDKILSSIESGKDDVANISNFNFDDNTIKSLKNYGLLIETVDEETGETLLKIINAREMTLEQFKGSLEAFGVSLDSEEGKDYIISYLSAQESLSHEVDRLMIDLKNNLVGISGDEMIEYLTKIVDESGKAIFSASDFIYDELTGTYTLSKDAVANLDGLSQEQQIAYWKTLIENISAENFEDYLSQLENLGIPNDFKYLALDAGQEYFNEIISLITSGIEGTLSNEEAQKLTTEAAIMGFEGFEGLTFTPTENGLQLENASAWAEKFYNHYKKEANPAAKTILESFYSELEKEISDAAKILERENEIEKTSLNLKNKLTGLSEKDIVEYATKLGLDINYFIWDALTGTYYFDARHFDKLGNLSQEQQLVYWNSLLDNIKETDYDKYLAATTALGVPPEFQYLIKDAQNELFESIISSVTSAIGGGASYEEANQLIKEYNLDLSSDFIETADGLKITQDAVLQIYNDLKVTKPLAAQIVLDNLTESIMESEEGLNDIYQIEEKIRKIDEEINNAKTSDSRKKILQDELTLAKNIHKELLAAGDAFNFMEQDLPTGMTNPLSAWEGLGQAFEVLDGEDFKAGYIDYTDLYNMISMMDEAGIDLKNVATNFNGDAVEASELMKAAAAAMVSVDGEVFVDLTKLGETFKLNADGMKEGIADGLEVFAQSQIELLDSQIAFLETIVAQEKVYESIDSNADKKIDLKEFTPMIDAEGISYWSEQQKQLLEYLKKNVGDFTLATGETLNDLIDNPVLFNSLDKKSQEFVINLINALNPFTNKENWDQEEIQKEFANFMASYYGDLTIAAQTQSSLIDKGVFIPIDTELEEGLVSYRGTTYENIEAAYQQYLIDQEIKTAELPEVQATASQVTVSTKNGEFVFTTPEGEELTVEELIAKLNLDDTAALETLSAVQTALDTLTLPDHVLTFLQQAVTKVKDYASAANSISQLAVDRIGKLKDNLNNIPIGTKTLKVALQVSSSGGVSVASVDGTTGAKGNVATVSLAKGNARAKGTLMGELGPELYATGGHYYVAGQNGAEFVDLPDDAIVFNHLQTRRLLENGSINGTGTAVTSEKKAVALATGNTSGPAMASASDALNQLIEIRAMWQSLLNKSAKDLGKKAGGGSGGSGGGGGGSDEDNKAFIHDLERWYNLLRQIEKLEQQITYEQAKRANMQSGYNHVASLEKELVLLKKQQAAHQKLSDLQKDYYDKRRKDLLSTDYSKIFTYDQDGLMQYVDGKDRGLDILATLNATDENGKAIYTLAEQLAYLRKVGFDTKVLETNADGTKVEDEEQMLQNFWDGVDGWMEELDGLYDSYNESMTSVQESIEAQMEIQQEYIDNQLTVEEKLLQAIIDREQAEIDRLQEEKEALDEATSAYIDGLNNALNREKEMYEKNDTSAETSRLQRQLAILQRSGGSAAEIRSLQDQIDSRLQDAYFQEQQDQIDAIQEASNNQLEKMQEQIDIMTEALEYQKENGLLWTEVYEMMNLWTPEQMLQFIEEFTKSYKENSDLQNQEDSEETQKQLEIYKAGEANKERDEAWADFYKNLNYEEEFKNKHAIGAQAVFNEEYAKGGLDEAKKAAEQYYKNNEKPKTPTDNNENLIEPENKPTIESGGSNSGKTESEKKNIKKTSYRRGDSGSIVKKIQEALNKRAGKNFLVVDGIYGAATENAVKRFQRDMQLTEDGIAGPATLKKLGITAFKTGGLVDFTGPAWVDGTKSKPEAFLSASDTAMLKSKIFSNSDGSLKALVAALEEITNNTSRYSTENNTEQIVIQNAQVNIQPGVISNDYSARRAGEMALEEMVKIARKTTNRVVSR